MKTLLKKILPKSIVIKLKKLHKKKESPQIRRATNWIGMNKKAFKKFMKDQNSALNTKQLHIFGAMKKTCFLKESKAFIIESIFDDAYQLEKIPIDKNSKCKIIDVGANVGVFAIAARGHFRNSTIHCYEPNKNLEPYLKLQTYAAGAKYYIEGVGIQNGFFASDERQNEILQSKSVQIVNFTKTGNIKITALEKCLERIGGYADILKLDCEGSEWVILKDKQSLQKVKFLTVEFHRISPDNSFDIYDRSVDIHLKAKNCVINAGFEILFERYHSVDAGIILAKRI